MCISVHNRPRSLTWITLNGDKSNKWSASEDRPPAPRPMGGTRILEGGGGSMGQAWGKTLKGKFPQTNNVDWVRRKQF